MATPSCILMLLTLFILVDFADEVKKRDIASGSQGLRGEVVERRSLPPGDGTPPLPVGGSQRSAGAAGQHLRHAKLQPARPEHGERKRTCFLVSFADLSWQSVCLQFSPSLCLWGKAGPVEQVALVCSIPCFISLRPHSICGCLQFLCAFHHLIM